MPLLVASASSLRGPTNVCMSSGVGGRDQICPTVSGMAVHRCTESSWLRYVWKTHWGGGKMREILSQEL